MADWKSLLKDVLLADGAIDIGEAKLLRREILADGKVDRQEMAFLAELRAGARFVCPEFTRFFFAALESNILEDGEISAAEVKMLRAILFADGQIDADEKAFLRRLRRRAKDAHPSFEALCKECL
jgi:uncharacterized tellurite resistance protein B-like protein